MLSNNDSLEWKLVPGRKLVIYVRADSGGEFISNMLKLSHMIVTRYDS